MKSIKVKEFNAAPGNEFLAHTYPGTGAYLNRDGNIYIVLNGGVFSLPGGQQLLSSEAEGAAGGGITGDVLLKALAIAQDPTLATSLLKA